MFALLGCAARPPASTTPAAASSDTPTVPAAIDGPWTERGHYVDLAAGSDGVHAVWVRDLGADGTDLVYARGEMRDGGFAWSIPVRIAGHPEAGDNGQIRPEIALDGQGRPVVLFTDEGRVRLAQLRAEDGGWTTVPLRNLEAPGTAALGALAIVDGKPVVAWLDTRTGATTVWAGSPDGAETQVLLSGEDGVCMCCKPALLAGPHGLALAVRDADGPRRDMRLVVRDPAGTWSDQGDRTHGAWSPGGCPADGPALAPEALYASDARDGVRRIWRADEHGERAVAPLQDGWEAVQPRVSADGAALAWVEVRPGLSALFLATEGAPPALVALGALFPGDPVRVGDRWWLPYEDGMGKVVTIP